MAYAPASNMTTTGSIAHLQAIWYNKTALDQLKKKFRFLSLTEPDVLPARSGKTVQWFRYTLFAANTTPSAEGTVGVALPLTTSVVSATVSEYSDFITVSTLLKETAIDPIVSNAAEQLGYRAGLSVDTIVRTEFDSVGTSATDLSTLGDYLTVSDCRRVKALLEGADVLPKDGDNFLGVFHPYSIYDLMADNSAGGFIDLTKYGDPERNFSGEVGKVGGVRIVQSTNVYTSGTAPNVLYYGYIGGKGAVGSVDLSGAGPSRIEDPSKQSFRINTIAGGPNLADPEGKIGAAVSYRFVFVAKILDTSTYRYRRIKCDASLV